MKAAQIMCQLMDCIDKHKQIEEDQTQGKGKAKVFPFERRDPWLEEYNHSQPRREFVNQSSRANTQVVSLVFKESVYQILDKIKNEPYFKWLNKIEGDPSKCNQSLYCQYHQDRGHTTEDCRTLCDHLDHLVKSGKQK